MLNFCFWSFIIPCAVSDHEIGHSHLHHSLHQEYWRPFKVWPKTWQNLQHFQQWWDATKNEWNQLEHKLKARQTWDLLIVL